MTEVLEAVFVKSQKELGDLLNASRKSIGRWMKEESCPGKTTDGFNVTLWRMWAAEKDKAPRAVQPQTKQDLDIEKVRLQNEKLSIENAVKRGELTSQDEVNRIFGEMVTGFAMAMRQMKHEIAANIAGCDVGEASKRVGVAVNEKLLELSLGDWAEKKTFWSGLYAEQRVLLKTLGLGDGLNDT